MSTRRYTTSIKNAVQITSPKTGISGNRGKSGIMINPSPLTTYYQNQTSKQEKTVKEKDFNSTATIASSCYDNVSGMENSGIAVFVSDDTGSALGEWDSPGRNVRRK